MLITAIVDILQLNMATGGSSSAAPLSTDITDNQRRWVVFGICLNKLLTPVLRSILKKEIPVWYNKLCIPPKQINKQTFRKHEVNLPPSKINLNYGNINKNYDNHKKKYNAYDYNVNDPESLAKLFVQPFMAAFSGFDQTMDLSAALAIIYEADPFHTSGAAAQANTVRSEVRNEWAHCNFAYWSDANYRTCMLHIESLVKKLNLPSADENQFVNELNDWKEKGIMYNRNMSDIPLLFSTLLYTVYKFSPDIFPSFNLSAFESHSSSNHAFLCHLCVKNYMNALSKQKNQT